LSTKKTINNKVQLDIKSLVGIVIGIVSLVRNKNRKKIKLWQNIHLSKK